MTVSEFRGRGGDSKPGRWGKAGERLDAAEAEERDRIRARRRNEARALAEKGEAEARRVWAAGLLRPHRITLALDLRSLEGPEVDIACGAKEPDVDRWEEGELYPSWEQLCLLARLTDQPLSFFARQESPEVGWSTIDFHVKVPRRDPVLRFSHTALVMAGIREPDERPAGEDLQSETLF